MRTNHSMFTRGVLAACFVVALGTVGCGDDEEPTPTGGTGGSTSGSGGSGGGGTGGTTGGTGGRAGAGTGGSGGPNATMCIANVASVTMSSVDAACGSCLCNMGLAATNACNAMPMCWQLIGCIRDNCPNDPMSGCATTTCVNFLGGAGAAQMVGPVIRGACASVCTTGGGEGGMPDAGL